MTWFVMGPIAANSHLWLRFWGPGAPEYGVWRDAHGSSIVRTLGDVGPPGVDVEWYLQQPPDHRGKRLVDALWQYGRPLKVYSEKLCRVLEASGGVLQSWPADVRLKDGTAITGYRTVLEDTSNAGPVHSMWKGRRTGEVVINEVVRQAIADAKLAGLEFEPTSSAFPGDNGYYDDVDD